MATTSSCLLTHSEYVFLLLYLLPTVLLPPTFDALTQQQQPFEQQQQQEQQQPYHPVPAKPTSSHDAGSDVGTLSLFPIGNQLLLQQQMWVGSCVAEMRAALSRMMESGTWAPVGAELPVAHTALELYRMLQVGVVCWVCNGFWGRGGGAKCG